MDEFAWLILFAIVMLAAMALGFIGFFIALNVRKRLNEGKFTIPRDTRSEERIEALEQRLAAFEARGGKKTPTSKTPEPEPEKTKAKDAISEPIPKDADPSPEPAVAEGPWAAAKSASVAAATNAEPTVSAGYTPPPKEPTPPKGPGFFSRAFSNFQANWVIWIAGLSLALGGTFIVQYGLEHGVIGPTARVILSLLFGAALVFAAEYMRRREGHAIAPNFSVPVALAAGGIASLFAGVISAHTLYDLTSPIVAFVSIAVVAFLALAGGLIYGPVLAVIGLIGAFVTPMIVDNPGPTPPMLYGYFLMVLIASLFVERLQKWIWLSSLAVAFAIFWGLTLQGDLSHLPILPLYMAAVIVATVTIPAFGAPPIWVHTGFRINWKGPFNLSHSYPTALAIVTVFVASFLTMLASVESIAIWQTSVLTLLGLLVASVFLCSKAENLDSFTPIFAFSLLGTLVLPTAGNDFTQIGDVTESTPPLLNQLFPWAATAGAAIIAVFLLAALWRIPRSIRPGFWTWLAALVPIIVLPLIWAAWEYNDNVDTATWAFAAFVLAVVQTGMAVLLARQKDAYPPSADIFTCSALILLAIVATALHDGTVLTMLIALLAVVSVALEARYDFRYVAKLLVVFAALAMTRLVLSPGIDWAMSATWRDFGSHFIGTGIVLAVGVWLAQRHKRAASHLVFETATYATVAIFLSVAAARYIAADDKSQSLLTLGLFSAVWGVLALVQMRRLSLGGAFHSIRVMLASLYGSIAGVSTALAVTLANPLATGRVQGPFLFDSMALAYLAPCLLLWASLKLPVKVNWLTPKYIYVIAAALIGLYGALEIRRFWHGDILSHSIILTEELYSYTVVLLLLTIAIFTLSILRKNKQMRTIGLSLAAVTALKVFLWDMSGLQGLGRASAFIGLGLTLAGIGWLHQKFRTEDQPPETVEEETP